MALRLPILLSCAGCAACGGAQSSLSPAGAEAERIATLFWGMTGGSLAIWIAVVAMAAYAARASPGPDTKRLGKILIVGGGIVFPLIVLSALLAYGLSMLPPLLAHAPEARTQIAVTGEQWWWRVSYRLEDGRSVELANELYLPRGERVQLWLRAADVIHSFWIPSLAGKMDMIPGRETHLSFEPTRAGTYRGVCAEYCGASHAIMGFMVRVVERDEFERWLARQAAPALLPTEPVVRHGAAEFDALGCGACHTIRGTGARGAVGPDLTHVGSRLTIGAGLLPARAGHFRRWLASTAHLKPGVRMPTYAMVSEARLLDLAAYLESLR